MPKVASLSSACCGCGVCAAKCSKGCIEMRPDECGFLHPAIDDGVCIRCGGCDRVCPAIIGKPEDKVEEVLWAKSNDDLERLNSSSGGVFALLSHSVLSSGGVVCGAAWNEGCKQVHHVLVGSEKELDRVMRSKYVQSSVGVEVYEEIRDALRADRRVLFAGTACQVAGMRAYLGKLADADGFLAVDVICHGVPSPLLWEKWAMHREKRAGAALHDVNMRSKTTSWLSYSSLYQYREEKDDSVLTDGGAFSKDWFMKAFLANASLRSSCFACPVKRSCGSDITLGDFWGIQSAHPEVDYEGGVSAVLCNTNKGVVVVEALKPRLEWGESTVDKVLPGNPSLVKSVVPYAKHSEFMDDLSSGADINELMERYDFKPSFWQGIRGKLSGAKRRLLRLLKR